MSWSVSCVGTRDAICRHLDEQSTKLTGFSKEEFDAALPHMKGLVNQNISKSAPNRLIKLVASGHGSKSGDEITDLNCVVSIEPFWGHLVI